MSGFFLVCKGLHRDRSAELAVLHRAFAELDFAPPEIIEDRDYVFAGFPTFGNGSIPLKRYPNGDFVFVCGTCVSNTGIGAAAAVRLQDGATTRPAADDPTMGHYAAILNRNGRTEIRLDRFRGLPSLLQSRGRHRLLVVLCDLLGPRCPDLVAAERA